ncbi:WW domain-binding protein 4 [Discoglossus pictus]
MADYWKSQPKKFCTYCKCWIADNKPSIEFHERGKNHKENVTKKISEIKQRSMDKAKEDEKKSKEFAAMEEAALKAYEEDLKRLEGANPAPAGPSVQQNKARDEQKWKEIEALERHHAKRQWTKGVSPEGYPYYYNTLTGESQWQEPEDYEKKKENSEENSKEKPGTSSVWVESVSEDGYTYYYNTETGESKWDKPEDYDPKQPPSNADNVAVVTKDEAAADPELPTEPTSEPTTEPPEDKSEDKDAESTGTKTLKISFRKKKETKSDSDEETEGESKEEEAGVEEAKPRSLKLKPRKPNPYGAWEAIKEEEDPYENVDLELPNVEYEVPPVAVSDLPQEPKLKFKEKAITSLGDTAGGSSTFFKKRKLENGKSRSIRQRVNDQ